MSVSVRAELQLKEELNRTILQSLISSFGIDPLLFEDKKGGDVTTINNIRKHYNSDSDIYIPEHIKNEHENRGEYKPAYINSKGESVKVDLYHTHNNYINKGKDDKKSQVNGQLHDTYRNTLMNENENRQLDHIISSHEVHNDAGRVLAGIDGVNLANQESNFQSTHSYVNNLKSNHSMDKFLDEILPKTINSKKERIQNNQEKLNSIPSDTPEQRHNKRKLEDKIKKEKEHIEVLESLNHEEMRKADKKARLVYDQQINEEYYKSSRFFKDTALASATAGFNMGLRQAIGLILAEIWFELREGIPHLYEKTKSNFEFKDFITNLKILLSDIWERVKSRFRNVLEIFKDGILSGLLSSLTTTFINIFMTTHRQIGRLIRELWSSLVSAAKLIFFNPNKLTVGELTREVIRVLSIGASVSLGVIINQTLASVMTFPFGIELAAFVSAIATGLITLGITYFLDHSEVMQKVWRFLDQFKNEARQTLEYFQKVNAELDRYLIELASLEFNLDVKSIAKFTDDLLLENSEYERSLILAAEINKRSIEIPFEPGNVDSLRSWLKGL
ncbi:hypothetical protein [uncultured Oceanisphaera sp.]|uniref:hypothetical protein n=1 Tax=uncultured Oceanisphaera sp. TaxID=353858 RepID=UPI002629B8E0|nr:hypothetical protein [uncultured Oceanisphaera sp.]